MQILKIVNSNDDGGVFTCERQYIESLTRKGHSVDLVIIGQGKNLGVYKSLSNRYVQLPDLNAQLSGTPKNIANGINTMRSYAKRHYNFVFESLRADYDGIIYRRP